MSMPDKGKRKSMELREDALKLKKWLLLQPHLPHDIEDEFLISFVNGTNSLEIAKQKLDFFYTFRTGHPEIFGLSSRNVLGEELKTLLTSVKTFVSLHTTPKGRRVAFLIFNNCKFDRQHLDIILMMTFEMILMLWPDAKGLALAIDLGGIDTSILAKLNLTSSVLLDYFQNAVPIRFKRAVYFNAPQFIHTSLNLIMCLVKDKIKDRIIISNQGPEVLQEYFPLDTIPCEYGGLDKSSDELNEYWYKTLTQNRDWLIKTSLQCVDEKKRPPDTKNTFGVDGNFKSLAFD